MKIETKMVTKIKALFTASNQSALLRTCLSLINCIIISLWQLKGLVVELDIIKIE
jgi:hypothetical protein